MVLNVNEYIVLLCLFEQFLVVLEQLHSRLCDEYMNAALDSVQRNRVMSSVRCEDGDSSLSAALCGQQVADYLLALPFGSASIAVL